MKRVFLFSFVLGVSISMYAQKTSVDNIPAPVVTTFKSAYPTAEKIQWELDEDNYMAGFVMHRQEKSAYYNSTGKWLKTETPVRVLDVPRAVKKSVSKNFKYFKMVEPVKVETPENGVLYKMELAKNELTYEVEIKEDGELTKQKEK